LFVFSGLSVLRRAVSFCTFPYKR